MSGCFSDKDPVDRELERRADRMLEPMPCCRCVDCGRQDTCLAYGGDVGDCPEFVDAENDEEEREGR